MRLRLLAYFLVALFSCLICLVPTGCGGNGASPDSDTATYIPLSDTLSELFGRVNGVKVLADIDQIKSSNDSAFDMQSFREGLAVVLDKRHPMAFANGVFAGLQINNDLYTLENCGIKTDRKLILDLIEKTLSQKNNLNDQQIIQEYNSLAQRITDTGIENASKVQTDSIQKLYGIYWGIRLGKDIENYKTEQKKDYNLPEFFKGLRKVASKSNKAEFDAGVYQSIQLSELILVTEQQGVNLRRNIVLENIFNILDKGSSIKQEIEKDSEKLTELLAGLQRARFEEEDRLMSQDPKAIQNIKTSEALITKLKKENPNVQTTSSGLSYVIENPGVGDKIKTSETIVVRYTASHLDGKIFDSDEHAEMTVANVIPGLTEGLKMLAKGGKAKFWIPGRLGYGGHGLPAKGIGPMETIVFEVEILDVKAK